MQSQLATRRPAQGAVGVDGRPAAANEARLDELCARAAEVSVGSSDTDRFAHDVDDLVLELEGLHQAVQELPG